MAPKRKRGDKFTEKLVKYKRQVSSYVPRSISSSMVDSVQKPAAYAATLLDPFTFKGVRIPDLSCFPTATLNTEVTGLWSPVVTAANNTQAFVFDLCPDGGGQCQLVLGENSSGTKGNRDTAGTNFISGSTGKANFTASVQDRFAAARLVSAGIKVEFAGNDSTTKGSLNIVALTSNGVDVSGDAAASTTYWSNITEPLLAVTAPYKRRNFYAGPAYKGVHGTYRPMDGGSFVMATTKLASPFSYGGFVVSLSGLGIADTAPSFIVSMCCNWEGIVSDNTFGMEQEAVYANTASLEAGMGAASSVPSTGSYGDLSKNSAKAKGFLG